MTFFLQWNTDIEDILKNVALQTRLDPTNLHCILCSTLACTFTEVKSSMCLLLFVLSCNSLNLPLKVCRFSQGRSQTECFKCQTKRAEYHGFLNDILRIYSRLPGCSRKLMNVGPCRAQEKTEACYKQDHLKPSKQENKVEKRINPGNSHYFKVIKLIIWFNVERRTFVLKILNLTSSNGFWTKAPKIEYNPF